MNKSEGAPSSTTSGFPTVPKVQSDSDPIVEKQLAFKSQQKLSESQV